MRRLRPLHRRARQRERREQTSLPDLALAVDQDPMPPDGSEEFMPFVPVSREIQCLPNGRRVSRKKHPHCSLLARADGGHVSTCRACKCGVRSWGSKIKFSVLLSAVGLIAAGLSARCLTGEKCGEPQRLVAPGDACESPRCGC